MVMASTQPISRASLHDASFCVVSSDVSYHGDYALFLPIFLGEYVLRLCRARPVYP
jgi:hypothetical protein